MASLEDTSVIAANYLAEHAGGILAAPLTVQGMVDLLGGGRGGRSALARELAAERGIKYESARRNIERYTTERGTERRTPKRLQGDLAKIAAREAGKINADRIIREARAQGGVSVDFAGYVKISNDERYREFRVTIAPDDMREFVNAAQRHEWFTAANELNYAVLQAWDEGRGNITGHGGAITDVDEFGIGYGE